MRSESDIERGVAITGVGLVTPFGEDPAQILARLERGDSAAGAPRRFDARSFACPVCAEIPEFDATRFVADRKSLRLMGRDAIFAAAAARLAVRDAGIEVGRTYAPEEVALFGATGTAGIELDEVAPLIRNASDGRGGFDARRFGSEALLRVRPILSFKILSNMPICFVSIFERLRGPNAVYNPWEGQAAQAIGRGIAAIRRGETPCALAGGCDVKTHALAFIGLEQQGVFRPWHDGGRGTVPGEGAAFLVLEEEGRARTRGARILARIRGSAFGTMDEASDPAEALQRIFARLAPHTDVALISAEEGDGRICTLEERTFDACGVRPGPALRPKAQLGNLFAAAAAVQVALAAAWAKRAGSGCEVLANCFGHGSEKAAFLMDGV